jgi:Ala-tRNA(Pro) deacylase
MAASELSEFLSSRGIPFEVVPHLPTYTAPETAEMANVAERDFAKTVIVEIKGRLAMIVVPANRRIVLEELRDMLGADEVRLATEAEFKGRFAGCEVGAMPPFGNLYGLPVFVAQSLADEAEIAFNACNHHEVIKMSFADFADMVRPAILNLATV